MRTGNTGGKAYHFPLWDEGKRAWTPDCDCDEEQPLLLDPCKASDVVLISFKDDGEAMPRHDEKKRPKAFKRANESIKYYNINHSDFKKTRIELRDEMSGLVKNASRYYKKLETGDATHEHAYEEAIRTLKKMRDPKSRYSSFCVAFLDKYKHQEFLEGAFY